MFNTQDKLNNLQRYINLIFPYPLEKDEYINIFTKKDRGKKNSYHKDIEEINSTVSKYLGDYNIYISLSTCKSINGTRERKTNSMYNRYCIGLDFDKKDFDTGMELDDFINHYKSKTGLDYHFIIDSGNGYHFYILIEGTNEIQRVKGITKRFSKFLGADMAVAISTQMLRLPCTVNVKYINNPKQVKIVTNLSNINDDEFNRYTLDFLESRLLELGVSDDEIKISTHDNKRKKKRFLVKKDFICVKNMLENGVSKGHRNKCMGRIVNYFRDILKLDKNEALEEVLIWNNKCNDLCLDEQKSDVEAKSEFDRYWYKRYDLLGCISDNNSFSEILGNYCDESSCEKTVIDSDMFYELDKRYANDKCLNVLDGYAYLILRLLSENSNKKFKISELSKTLGLSKKVITKSVKMLTKLRFIKEDKTSVASYKIAKIKEAYGIQIMLPKALYDRFIDKAVTAQEFKVYLAIRRNSYAGISCSQDNIGEILNLDRATINRIIKEMISKNIIEISEKKSLEDYSAEAYKKYNYYGYPLERFDLEESQDIDALNDTVEESYKNSEEDGEEDEDDYRDDYDVASFGSWHDPKDFIMDEDDSEYYRYFNRFGWRT